MRIYWIRAQAPLQVLALAKHLAINATFLELDAKAGALKAPEYARLNPNRKAPTLVDGDTVLWEASAIMAYLSIQAGSDLWPAQRPVEQIEVLRWLSWNDCHWAPAVGPFYFEHIVKATFDIGVADRDSLRSAVPDLVRHAAVLDANLAGQAYVACARLTIADFRLGAMARYWQEAEIPLAAFPHIVAWLDRLKRLPAWADPWPARA